MHRVLIPILIYLLLVDAVLQKPFEIQDISSNDERFCQTYYWKLFDKSPPRRTYEDPKNLTVYFGRNFLLNDLSLVLSSDENQALGKLSSNC